LPFKRKETVVVWPAFTSIMALSLLG
jgi:hypothetical protein